MDNNGINVAYVICSYNGSKGCITSLGNGDGAGMYRFIQRVSRVSRPNLEQDYKP